jgi:hypothetical protein
MRVQSDQASVLETQVKLRQHQLPCGAANTTM